MDAEIGRDMKWTKSSLKNYLDINFEKASPVYTLGIRGSLIDSFRSFDELWEYAINEIKAEPMGETEGVGFKLNGIMLSVRKIK